MEGEGGIAVLAVWRLVVGPGVVGWVWRLDPVRRRKGRIRCEGWWWLMAGLVR